MFDKIMANAPPSFYFDAIPPPAHGHIAERSVPPLRFPARTSVPLLISYQSGRYFRAGFLPRTIVATFGLLFL